MQHRFNYIEYKKGDEEYRLEYDSEKNRLFYKENDLFVFEQHADADKLKNNIDALKKEWENNGYANSAEGFHDGADALLIQKIFDKAEKDSKSNAKKEEKPKENKNEEELKKEYFNIANNELPQILSEGFIKAIKKHRKSGTDENEICCILDIKNNKMVFAYGDGDECENSEDENVFLVYSCNNTLSKCKSMAESIETLNLRQESGHWLNDAINIADEQGALDDLSIAIYGNVQFGDIELDVIYES